MDNILELTYKIPQQPLVFRNDYTICWMCRLKLDEDKPVWKWGYMDRKLYYCSEKCKKDHQELISGWKP